MVTLVVTVAVALPAFMSSVNASGYSPAALAEADRQPAATAASTAQRMTRPTLVSLFDDSLRLAASAGLASYRPAGPTLNVEPGNADPAPAPGRASPRERPESPYAGAIACQG